MGFMVFMVVPKHYHHLFHSHRHCVFVFFFVSLLWSLPSFLFSLTLCFCVFFCQFIVVLARPFQRWKLNHKETIKGSQTAVTFSYVFYLAFLHFPFEIMKEPFFSKSNISYAFYIDFLQFLIEIMKEPCTFSSTF